MICYSSDELDERNTIPIVYSCPFEVSDFSKGGMTISCTIKITDENNKFRFLHDNGNCYETTLSEFAGVYVFELLNTQ